MLMYLVLLCVIMAHISHNLVMLQEHLEHIEAEVGQRWHTGAYAMLVMFKYVSQLNQQLESIYQASEYYHQHYGLFCSQCQTNIT
jgi:hypothetical protein